MRIGELTFSSKIADHSIKFKDVYVGTNKDKILVILYSSKTHDKSTYPQQIKISSSETRIKENVDNIGTTVVCPFKILR